MPDTVNALRPGVSVVLCCYTLGRWEQIRAACASVAAQLTEADELLVVVDHNDELLASAGRQLAAARVVASQGPPGLSGARNTGVAAGRCEIVAFLDDDAVAEEDWLDTLAREYGHSGVIGVGGHVEPAWQADPPAWFPAEFNWVVGCSHTGMPRRPAPVRNLIGANMSFRRDVLQRIGGFRPDLGRIGTRPVGCEETELCIRATAATPESTILYHPQVRVRHCVPAGRGTWSYFRSRCYAEGLSKAAVSRISGRSPAALSSERTYVGSVLPQAFVQATRSGELSRAAALLLGLATTTLGYLVGRIHVGP